MEKTDHLIWSNYDIDYEDWRDDLEAEHPDMTEDERISLMYDINNDYLDDERCNLDIQLSRPILIIGDLGRWNGRVMGYKEIKSGNIKDCLYSDTDYSTCRTTIRFATNRRRAVKTTTTIYKTKYEKERNPNDENTDLSGEPGQRRKASCLYGTR